MGSKVHRLGSPGLKQLTPIQIQPGTRWASVSANYDVSFGVRYDGSLWAWGSNRGSELGLGLDVFSLCIGANCESFNLRITTPQQIGGTITVRFLDYDGRVIDTQTVERSSEAIAPAAPTREGYRFIGWFVALFDIDPYWKMEFCDITANLGSIDVFAQYSPQGQLPTPPQPWQSPVPQAELFPDSRNHPWAQKYIGWAVANEITTGFDDNTFRPNTPVTRAQFVTFFHRIYGRPAAPTAQFIDMPTNQAFRNAISWAAHSGVTAGVGGGQFAPNRNITREQLATMLHRYIAGGVPAPVNMLGGYTDQANISTWPGAREGVNWAVYHGIMGEGMTTLSPRSNATRAQTVAMLHRVVETFDISAPR